MLLWLAQYLSALEPGFAVFQYLTLRAILSVLTALVAALFLGPWFIRSLELRQIGQSVRMDGPESQLSKQGTPTMGGVLILVCITASTLIWGDLTNAYVWIALMVMVDFVIIGWIDDWNKIVQKNSRGLSAKRKYLGQSIVGLIAAILLYHLAKTPEETTLLVPFFKDLLIPLGFGYVILAYFVIVGTSNAVNLTDGLDGLAILPTVLVAGALGVFAYLTGNIIFSEYLFIPYIPGAGELVVFLGAMVGAGLGFLWFNTYPAQVFMGDVGALSLGAALGVVAVMVRQELVLFIMGGIFVLETVSFSKNTSSI